jgi:hypothetical protein
MKHMWLGMFCVLALACGDGGSLPPPEGPPPGSNVDPSGQQPGEQVEAQRSLWPLTTGSRWTYRITDDVKGVFEKNVEVKGLEAIPEGSGSAILVHSVQPHIEERSWQVENGGIVARVREEDLKEGSLVRVTTWAPGTVKSISTARELGWVHQALVREVIRDSTGGTLEDRDKTYVWRIVEVNATVQTPAGTFTGALKIERDRPDKTGKLRTYWLVAGVGKVREEGERTEELMSYEIK